MEKPFSEELDTLISKHKLQGAKLGEMIADMECAVEGLVDEERNA